MKMKLGCFRPLLHIVYAKLGQAQGTLKLIMKHDPKWVQTSKPLIRSPARYHWTAAPTIYIETKKNIYN